ncbi:MAG: efflux RND transporter periplasmic adaptor subunit [Acidobacteria bacterium]|nr:efflux RND transporter periplasmic adaptor subunit [Acidobacteriota bacterium]MBI3280542.1 efflux RND transporter periplasmic adaptor subunit [Acidobacteriota bacterium]
MTRTIGSIAFILALLSGCSRERTQPAVQASTKSPEPLAVRVATAESRRVDRIIALTGSLHPDETVNLSAEVPGRIAAIHADFGQPVRRGQVLVELDRRELALQVERSRASLSQALARIGLDAGQENAKPESTPAIRQALAQMEDARSKFENAQRLIRTGDISQERFSELDKTYRARQAALEAARDEMRTQLAAIQAMGAELKLAEKRLGDTTVRAPFDGAVSQKLVSPGQYLKENTPILTLVKTYPMRLRVDMPESAAGLVRVGSSLTFTTDAAPEARFRAVVRELNPSLDARSRSLSAEARLVSGDPRLRPGMFVQVELVTARQDQVVVVPRQALYQVAGLTKLFVIRGGRAVERKIPPGQQLGDWTEVPRAVLSPGEQVAVSNLAQLTHGAAVRTQPQS